MEGIDLIKIKKLDLILITFVLVLVLFSSISNAQENKSKTDIFFSLRNDDSINVGRPVGSSPKEVSKEEKRSVEKPEQPVSEEVKEAPTEEKQMIPLRFEGKAEALPHQTQITSDMERRKIGTALIPSGELEIYRNLSSSNKGDLTRIKTDISQVIQTRQPKKISQPRVVATPEVKIEKKIIPTLPAAVPSSITIQTKKEPVEKEKQGFSFASLSLSLRLGIILSGIATLILVIIVIYLLRQKEVSLTELEEGMTPSEDKNARYKSLSRDIRDLKVGYKEIEKTVEDMDKKLNLIGPLKGTTIDEFTRKTSREVFKPVENGVKDLQNACENLEKMLEEVDTRLSPLDALKGLSIKELAQQTSMEFYRPLENEFKKMNASYERMIGDFEDRLDKKVDGIVKKNKDLEKVMEEIDGKITAIDSTVSLLSQGEDVGILRGEKKQPDTNKIIDVRKKKDRETLYNQIYKMSDEGLSVDEIAQRTKMGKGEVRLILGLRKK